VPITDVGPEGDDRGKGGRYLLIPPGYKGNVPEGYFPIQTATYNGYALFRAIPATSSASDLDNAISLVKKMRLYSLAQAENPPASHYIDIVGKLFDGIPAFDDTFYDRLAKMVDEEPVQTRDLVAMAQLRSLGIEKDKAFNPDQATRDSLKTAAAEAQAGFMQASANVEPWWPDTRWGLPAGAGPKTAFTFLADDRYEIDDRGQTFFLAYAVPKKLGAATVYVGAFVDAKDAPLQGDKIYRLQIPANVPAKQYWAVLPSTPLKPQRSFAKRRR